MDRSLPAALAGRRWWHAIDVAPGVTTPGTWDNRPVAAGIPWPGPLAGQRCLDVGTRDGFWAFEMERRGAAQVVGIDVRDRDRVSDTPFHLRRPSAEEYRPGDNFRAVAAAVGSRSEFRELNIYDLRPADVGLFDLVFVGYMLHQLRDPVGALEAVRGVCRGAVIVLDEVLFFRSLLTRTPLARFGHRRDFAEWFYFNAAGLRRVVEFAGFRVTGESPFLYYGPGPGLRPADIPLRTRLRYAVGRAACSLAVRGEVAGPTSSPA